MLLLLSCTHGKQDKNTVSTPYLVVLSADGFRWDYPQQYNTPALHAMATEGIKAHSLQPSFPSKTFPNHYSIATGLYPGNHGIIANDFEDPILGHYSLRDRKSVLNSDFYGGEPIWITAEKQHIHSACFFWPGSEAPIKGIHPSIWKEYNQTEPFEARVDSVIKWLQLPFDQRPHLIMCYLHEPDKAGHNSGPFSEETRMQVNYVDSIVNDFRAKFASLSIHDSINFIVLSDHGMGHIEQQKSIALFDYLKPQWLADIHGDNPMFTLNAHEAYYDSVWQALSNIPHIEAYKKEEQPARYHFTKSDRIGAFVCVADSAWALHLDRTTFSTGGTHGYDPANKDMHAIFYAVGPAFNKGIEIPTFENVNLYSLFANILGLNPAPTDGSLEPFKGALKRLK